MYSRHRHTEAPLNEPSHPGIYILYCEHSVQPPAFSRIELSSEAQRSISIPTHLFSIRIALASATHLANVMKKKYKVGFTTVTHATRALRCAKVNDYFGTFLFLLQHFDVAPLWLHQIVKESN